MAIHKSINHDSGPPVSDHYTSLVSDPGGKTSITAAAAMGGSANGLQVDMAVGSINLQETTTKPASNELRFKILLDPNGVTFPGAGDEVIMRVSINATSLAGRSICQFQITSESTSVYKAECFYTNDAASIISVGQGNITDAFENCLEIEMIRETSAVANDGEIRFYINNSQIAEVTNAANFTTFNALNQVRVTDSGQTVTGAVYMDELIIDDAASANLCGSVFSLAPMTKPVDIDADGSNLYLALLDSGNPILIKMATSLDADGSTVFEPGAGDDIGVQCGRFDADVVWVAGAFDGTNVVEKSEDGGATFTAKDPATFGDVEAFVVGPDSDTRVLIADDNIDIQETLDDGDTWTAINSGTGFNVNAIARLDKNVQESVFGNDAGATDNIDFSPNSGGDMEDFSTGFPTEDATRVIVN